MSERSTESVTAINAATVPPLNANIGMTTRVMHGSLWSFGGQVITLMASLVATPFVIRLLGNEAYGVLMLINLLVGYIGIADLGMGQASTKFGAEAHARANDAEEVAVVWTSLFVLSLPTVLISLTLALLAKPLVEHVFLLPGHLHVESILALRLAALTFVARSLASVLNTSQLVRMRIDLYASINTLSSLGQIVLVPIMIFYLGGGIITALAVVLCVAVATMVANAVVSWRLLPSLVNPKLNRKLVKLLLRYGGATAALTLVGVTLFNIEKLLLVRLGSVTELAYYSVAFTLARLLALFPSALSQPLLPAFARLQTTSEYAPLQSLYTRTLRGLLLFIVPLAFVVFISAKPLLTVWAGPEYGWHSVFPLYILLLGCLLDGLSYVPRILLSALGKPDVIVRYQLLNLTPYLLLATALIILFGAVGAALAWTIRGSVECLQMFHAVKNTSGLSPSILRSQWPKYAIALTALLVPASMVSWLWSSPVILVGLSVIALITYCSLVWTQVFSEEERNWVESTLSGWRTVFT